MGLRKIVRSKNTWIGAVAGMIAGPWALSQVRNITGVGVRLPKVGNGG